MAVTAGNSPSLPTRQGSGGAMPNKPTPAYTPIPCNTSPVDNNSGAGTNPDPSGCDPYCSGYSIPPPLDYFGG